jgi:hypothetical protein
MNTFRQVIAGLLLATASVPIEAAYPVGPRALFAKYDPEGRLRNTTIERLGTIRIGNSTFAIYYLNFTNPRSRHGQQRITIVKNGNRFIGSYQCTLAREEGKISVGRDRLTIHQDGSKWTIPFNTSGPTKTKHVCSDDSQLERSI